MAVARLVTKNRGPTAQSITIAEPTPPTKQKGKLRGPATQTITITETSLTRLANKIRTRSETTIIAETRARLATKSRALATQTTLTSESVARIKGAVRPLAVQTVTVSGGTLARLLNKIRTRAETVPISENLARLCSKARALAAQTVVLSDSVARVKSVSQKNVQKTLEDTTTITGGTLARLATKTRPLALQTVTIGANLARLATKLRALATQTITVGGGTITIQKGKLRSLAVQTVTVGGGTLARLLAKTRTRNETVVIAETPTRLSTKFRALAAQITALSDSVARTVAIQPKNVIRNIEQTVTVTTASLARRAQKTRTRSETVVISDNLGRLSQKIRALATQIVVLSDSVTRTKTSGAQNIVRALATQTVAVSESLARLTTKIRALTTQTVTIADTRNRSNGKSRALAAQFVTIADAVNRTVITTSAIVRSLVESITISESPNRLATKTRALTTQITAISENLARIKGKMRIVPAQTVIISAGTLARRTQKIRAFIENVTGYDILEAFKNGIRLVPPQPPDKGGSGSSKLYPKGPRIKRILYPVYHVRERLRIERQKKLRETVVIPAFKYNIHRTVAPFIIVNPLSNTVNVRFAIGKQEPIHFVGKIPIPIQIQVSHRRKEVHKARCASFVMNQKVIEKYGKRLDKMSKLMTLFFLYEQMPTK